ncbi:hypothetical protein EYF80_019047 [Liparis tanakae]|uniref:Uncharacterized protein n=1 Tax=Liparis tanakae TaxID=230148 RepID=A0A4Z2I0F9_9TELE|nr:hypothetical protein EYF80_019047 [Liparis tanakae]
MASSSSSGTWGMVRGSVSSGPWKVSSVRGMYHLLSYCWFLLRCEEGSADGEGLAQSSRSVKRKTCRNFLAPSTSSTMKLSLSSWRL